MCTGDLCAADRYVQDPGTGSKHLEQRAERAQAAASQILPQPLQGQPHTDVCWNRSATHLLVLARAVCSSRHLPSPGICYGKVVGTASQRNQQDAGKKGKATRDKSRSRMHRMDYSRKHLPIQKYPPKDQTESSSAAGEELVPLGEF